MALTHALEHGVLVITVDRDPGAAERALLAADISALVEAHRPSPVVIVLDEPATGSAAVGAVLRAHRACGSLGVLMSVATHSAPARRLLEASAEDGRPRLVIHARADIAIDAAYAAAA
ncbi:MULTISPECIES: hypothetical protein [unclassified Streptomyces]|uniref:hypothetical protein n=1 Tax=unclassified Streptomyces TaxID=2593676 RepID=UPI003D726782